MKRSGKRGKWFLAAGALALLSGVLPWRRPQPEYLRHISPPLPDGTRYTFLYPSRFGRVVAQNKLLIQLDDGASRPSSLGLFLMQWHLLPYPPLPTSRIIAIARPGATAHRPKIDKKESQFGPFTHDIILFDPRSAHSFQFNLRFPSPAERFAHEDEVMARSFRVLRPGENAEENAD